MIEQKLEKFQLYPCAELFELKCGNAVFKVRGLCGTLTWNQHDDFTTPEGDVENSVSSFAGKFTTGHCTLPRGAPPDPCSTYTQRRQYAETVCSVIHSPVFQVQFAWSVLHLCLCPPLFYSHVRPPPRFRRCVTTWWRGSPISASVCRRSAAAFPRGPVTAPSSPPTPDAALRRAPPSTGAITPSAVSGVATG